MTRIATTTAAAPQAELIDTELTGSAAAARHIAEGCLVDGPVGRVGLELEALFRPCRSPPPAGLGRDLRRHQMAAPAARR